MLIRTEDYLFSQGQSIGIEIKSPRVRNPIMGENICRTLGNKNLKNVMIKNFTDNKKNRANYIIVEESRLVPREILESIIKPFLYSRQPMFKSLPQYAEDSRLQEPGIISYITSSWFKSEYWFAYVRSTIKRMLAGDETSTFLAFDYLVAIKHQIKTEQMILDETSDMDDLTKQMEYYNIPAGQSGQSYYKNSFFKRTIKKPFYPQRDENYDPKKNPNGIKKVDGEIRIISCDIATRSNRTSDNSVISCIRMIPEKGRGYKRGLVYMESFKGMTSDDQAKRIKILFHDFEADYIVLDVQNVGVNVYDMLGLLTKVDERGIEIEAFTCSFDEFINKELREELQKRTKGSNPKPIIFPILGSPVLNSKIAVSLRSSLQKKMWDFLVNENEGEQFLVKTNKEYFSLEDESLKNFLLNPYVQTNLLIQECINLDMSLLNGQVRLTEKSGMYKDRYSSLSYGNYVISEVFDKYLLDEKEDEDMFDSLTKLSFFM